MAYARMKTAAVVVMILVFTGGLGLETVARTMASIQAAPGAAAAPPTGEFPQPMTLTAAQDRQVMLDLLGIPTAVMRQGPSGSNPKAPNYQNTDESKANPWPNLPDALVAKDRTPITTAELWWNKRRPEIVEYFDAEVYGRVPKNVPKVTWEVRPVGDGGGGEAAGGISKSIIGHVDNSAYPLITVDIQLTLTLPANAKGPVPIIMDFGGGGGKLQYLAKGWGYASLNPGSIQADNGQGLTRGIVGLVNKGQPRKPDDWGSLRAWAWGASRALDYLETDPGVDAKHVGISGLSRYGKATIVAMAYEPRFAIALVGSSGAGGAKLFRRNWGEQVENLTGIGEYHWMSGSFLKYGGPLAPPDIPVDAHELIALCAPRPTFISYGASTGPGAEGTWVDQKGSFMAAVAAGPVFKLLGKRDLGTDVMPPVETALVDGELAWRMHGGGHTTGPNINTFVAWAERYINAAAALSAGADQPAPQNNQTFGPAHAMLLEKARKGGIDIYFEGDSITRRWQGTDYPEHKKNWDENFFGWNAADFGWGGDTTQNVLYRLHHGELDDVNPKVIVLMIGTNNVGNTPPKGSDDAKVEDVVKGIKAILDLCREKAPKAIIILTGITPRNDDLGHSTAMMPTINKINERIATRADGKTMRYININDKVADAEGRLIEGITEDRLHLSIKGYQVWADALKPIFTELLGPPGKVDTAPPASGVPNATGAGGATSRPVPVPGRD
jgi:lysophospholipase L1-like esterase